MKYRIIVLIVVGAVLGLGVLLWNGSDGQVGSDDLTTGTVAQEEAPDRTAEAAHGAGKGERPSHGSDAQPHVHDHSCTHAADGSGSRVNIAEKYIIVDPRVDTIADTTKPRHERLETLLKLNQVAHDVTHEQDVQAMVELLQDRAETDTIRHEILNFLHSIEYPGMLDVITALLEDPEEKERFRAFCVQHMWTYSQRAGEAEQGEIADRLHDLLDDRHVPVRREALLALVRNGDGKGEETAVAWLEQDDNARVADLAIRCVKQLDLKEQIPTVRTYLSSTNEPARIAAIVALSEWGDRESLDAFMEATESDSVRLQRAGRRAMAMFDSAANR